MATTESDDENESEELVLLEDECDTVLTEKEAITCIRKLKDYTICKLDSSELSGKACELLGELEYEVSRIQISSLTQKSILGYFKPAAYPSSRLI